jgi:hypothetical protein
MVSKYYCNKCDVNMTGELLMAESLCNCAEEHLGACFLGVIVGVFISTCIVGLTLILVTL